MNAQEELWRGPFGDAYTERNRGRVEANVMFFAEILKRAPGIESVLEPGCGAGENLRAICRLLPKIGARMLGLDVNNQALASCYEAGIPSLKASILELPDFLEPHDLVLTKGVLIHVEPSQLERAYEGILRCARRYVLIAEYHSPRIEEIPYRGQTNVLWKGPYAEQLMQRCPELELLATGFASRLSRWPQDDLTWFLMEKRK